MKSLQIYLIILLTIAFTQSLFATHNIGGYITYRQINQFSIEATVTTFTKTSGQSQFADRLELDIHWGDGTTQTLARSNGPIDIFTGERSGEMVTDEIRKNEYTATHTYPFIQNPWPWIPPTPVSQFYTVWMQDPNRNEDILNINGGNSVNVEFYIESEIYLASPSEVSHSSAIPTIPSIYKAIVGQVFQFSPNAATIPGDSLAYEIVVPQSDLNTPVPGYQPVSDISPGANNQYSMDARSGLFSWDAPQQAGLYVIAIKIKSYTNGQYTGYVIYDLQIEAVNVQAIPATIGQTIGNDYYVWDQFYSGLDTLHLEFFAQLPDTAFDTIKLLGADYITNNFTFTVTNIGVDSQLVVLDIVIPQIPRSYDLFHNFAVVAEKGFTFASSNYKIATTCFILMKWTGGAVLGVEESTNAPAFDCTLFPNPAKGQLFLRFDTGAEQRSFQIFNNLGQLVYTAQSDRIENLYQIPIENLSAGSYFLKIEQDGKFLTKAFVVEP